MRGGSTAGAWNLILHTDPVRLIRVVKDDGLWRAFELDPPGKPLKSLRAPTRRDVIEAVRIAVWQQT